LLARAAVVGPALDWLMQYVMAAPLLRGGASLTQVSLGLIQLLRRARETT